MWYSIAEAAKDIGVEENKLLRKVILLNYDLKTFPGKTGQFISKENMLELKRMIQGDQSKLSEIIKNGQAIVHCSGRKKEIIERWVQKAAQTTNTKLDWGYRAGCVLVFCLGDEDERQRARDELGKPKEGIENVTILDDATVANAKI